MLKDRVRCATVNPGVVAVGSTITFGAVPVGYRSFLSAFGATESAYFVLSDGAGRTITGVWTVNAGSPETALITEILWNDRLGSTAGETFSSACVAWCAFPDKEVVLPRSTPHGGFRNLITNGNFQVNQRSYVSATATVAANEYTLDFWRVVTSGQNLTYSDSAGVRTVTFPAGGAEQVIEGINLIGGEYVASWTGTATCLVGGAAVTKGVPFTVVGGADLTVRMTGGTCSLLQIEAGAVVTPFERRPYAAELLLCRRYYEVGELVLGTGAYAASIIHYATQQLVPKRITPAVTFSVLASVNVSASVRTLLSAQAFHFYITSTAAGNVSAHISWAASAEP